MNDKNSKIELFKKNTDTFFRDNFSVGLKNSSIKSIDRNKVGLILEHIPKDVLKNIFYNKNKSQSLESIKMIEKDNLNNYILIFGHLKHKKKKIILFTQKEKINLEKINNFGKSDIYKSIYESLIKKELFKEAESFILHSLKSNKKNFYLNKVIADIYYKEKRIKKSLKHYLLLRKLKDLEPSINQRIGDIYYSLGKNKLAIKEYEKILGGRIDYLFCEYINIEYEHVIEPKALKKRFTDQLKAFFKPRSKKYELEFYKLGYIYWQKKENYLAIKYLEIASAINPKNKIYYNQLALINTSNHNYHKAIDNYYKLLKLEPKNIKLLIKLGFTYTKIEEYELAIDCYNQCLEIDPKNSNLYYYIGLTYLYINKDMDEVLLMFKKSLDLNPKNINSKNQLGLIYLSANQYEKAIKEYIECIKFDSKFTLAYKNLGLIYFQKNDNLKCIEYYTKSINLDERDFETYYHRGICYYELKKWSLAYEDFRKSLNYSEGNSLIVEKIMIDCKRKILINQEKSS